MEKRQVAPGCGVFFDGEWQVSNLKFLTEFMRMLGLSTGDFGVWGVLGIWVSLTVAYFYQSLKINSQDMPVQ